jgi:Zn-dependent protease
MATSLNDPTPRLWGRLSLRPSSWFDPFGSGLIPTLLAFLWAVGMFVAPAAYGKPAPIDPSYFRRYNRDVVMASLAGPGATLALAIAGGWLTRLPLSPDVVRFLAAFGLTCSSLTLFHLLPIPGLDGARMVALILPPQAREVYRNADKYLPLFVLVILFILGGLALGFLDWISGAICNAAAGTSCEGLMVTGTLLR